MSQRCAACSSILETIEYQSRSADEATRQKLTCPNCPVDAAKLSTKVPAAGPRGLPATFKHGRHKSLPVQLASTTRTSRLCVDVTSEINVKDWSRHIISPILLSRSKSVAGHEASTTHSRYNVTGPLAGKSERCCDTVNLGFGAVLETIELYTAAAPQESVRRVVVGLYNIIESCSQYTKYLYRNLQNNNQYVVVHYSYVPALPVSIGAVSELYKSKCVPRTLSSYLGKRLTSQYSNLSPRAWDAPAPLQGHVYTSKPDGDRKWLVLYGAFWYCYNCHGDKSIFSWWHYHKVSKLCKSPVVCDVEYEINTGMIFIDSLTTPGGEPVPIFRDLDYSLRSLSSLRSLYPECPLVLREYFNTNKDAEIYSKAQLYSTDGTLGIRNGSTETIKVKPIKAMDLLLLPNGSLSTSDGDIVASINNYPQEYESKVVEVRFTAAANEKHITVHDVFLRTNKITPNSTEAVENILSSCVVQLTPQDASRTAALKWCNSLRKLLVDRALRCDDTKHIVLDVGTGTGQSLDNFKDDGSVALVHIEPDEKRAVLVARRSRCRLLDDFSELAYMVRSLKTRKVPRVVVNCTLEQILQDAKVCDAIMAEVKCVLVTFSAHFVVDSLHEMRNKYKHKVYGCVYTYDNNVDGVLVNSCSASMIMSSAAEAVVKWGNEKEYTEPVTYEADYIGLGTIVLGSDIQRLRIEDVGHDVVSLCKNIRVIVP